MNRNTAFFVLVWLALCCTCPVSAELSILTEDLPPYNYMENGTLTGATTQVVQEIMRRLDISADIQIMPWARGYQRLRNESDVVLFTTALTKERESLFHWVGPLYVNRLEFYARKGTLRRLDSLDEARQVGAIATYKDDYGEQLLKTLGFTNLDSSNSPHSNVRKLVSGRVDLWFFHRVGAERVAIEADVDPGEFESVFTYQQSFSYIAMSKQTSANVVQQWQATLDEMKADGSFWWLTNKWLPPDAIMVSDRKSTHQEPHFLKLYTEDSPPSAYTDKGRVTGLSVELVREILRRIGQPNTIAMVPWARGYKLAQSEANTAVFSTSRLPQREALFSWVGPIYRQRWGLYKWKGRDIDIKDLNVARRVARIGTYHEDAKMQYLQLQGFENLVPTNKNITNVMHLKKGNIDLWVSSDFNMPHLARQAGVSPDQLELAYAFRTVGNYIAFSKQTSPHVIRLWQTVLDEMKSDGSYQRICQEYGYTP